MFNSKLERILFVVLAVVGILLTLQVNGALAGCNTCDCRLQIVNYSGRDITGWTLNGAEQAPYTIQRGTATQVSVDCNKANSVMINGQFIGLWPQQRHGDLWVIKVK